MMEKIRAYVNSIDYADYETEEDMIDTVTCDMIETADEYDYIVMLVKAALLEREIAEKMETKKQRHAWKVEAWHNLETMRKYRNSKLRKEIIYADYIKRFYFGDGAENFENKIWKQRKAENRHPMPFNIYFYG